jgi:hypothetical protein
MLYSSVVNTNEEGENSAAFTMRLIQQQFEEYFQAGDCAVTTLTPPPFNAVCTANEQGFSLQWFADFMNTECAYSGDTVDVGTIHQLLVSALDDEDFRSVAFHTASLARIKATRESIGACLLAWRSTTCR